MKNISPLYSKESFGNHRPWSGVDSGSPRDNRDERTVRRWADGTYEPPPDVLAWLETLAALHAANPPP